MYKLFFSLLIAILFWSIPISADLDDDKKEKIKKQIEIRKLANTAHNLLRFRKMRSAESYIKKIYKLDPEAVEYHYLQAVVYFQKSKYNYSLRTLARALAKNPHHDRAHSLFAMNYLKLGLWQNAVHGLENAKSKDPYNPFYRYNLAVAYFHLQKFEHAVGESSKAIELKKNYTYAKSLLVLSLLRLGKVEDAYQYYAEYRDTIGKDRMAYEMELMYLFDKKHDYDSIILQLKSKRTLTNKMLHLLALSYWHVGNLQKAYSNYKKLMKRDVGVREEKEYLQLLAILKRDREASKLVENFKQGEDEKKKLFRKYWQHILESRLLYRRIHWDFR